VYPVAGDLGGVGGWSDTLAKARIINTETMSLSDDHTAAVERQVLPKARQQTPGQLRAATSRAVLSTDPAAARRRAEQARRGRGVRMWPEPDGMASLSAYLPAADAVGVFAVLDEHARQSGCLGDERSMDARRGDALVDLVLNPTGYRSQHTSDSHQCATEKPVDADNGRSSHHPLHRTARRRRPRRLRTHPRSGGPGPRRLPLTTTTTDRPRTADHPPGIRARRTTSVLITTV